MTVALTTTTESQPPSTVNDNTLQQLRNLKKDRVLIASPVKNENVFSILGKKERPKAIVGRVYRLNLYQGMFSQGKFHKAPMPEADEPLKENFDPRADVYLETQGGHKVKISCAPSTTKFRLPDYLEDLEALRIRPEQVITMCTVETVKNKNGESFAVINFEAVDVDKLPVDAVPAEWADEAEETPPPESENTDTSMWG